jgi:hypothetical protein
VIVIVSWAVKALIAVGRTPPSTGAKRLTKNAYQGMPSVLPRCINEPKGIDISAPMEEITPLIPPSEELAKPDSVIILSS